jgi:hypothetical protein
MATNPVEKLQLLADANARLTNLHSFLKTQVNDIVMATPSDVQSELNTITAPLDAAFVTVLADLSTAIDAVSVTDPDRIEFATAAENEAKS